MTSVVDASALLAFLQGEPGSDDVEHALDAGAVCGAANWSEVAQKVRAAGRDWDLVKALLQSFPLDVEAVTAPDGEWAAARWRSGEAMSLADRLCLALGARLGCEILTADTSWSGEPGVHLVR